MALGLRRSGIPSRFSRRQNGGNSLRLSSWTGWPILCPHRGSTGIAITGCSPRITRRGQPTDWGELVQAHYDHGDRPGKRSRPRGRRRPRDRPHRSRASCPRSRGLGVWLLDQEKRPRRMGSQAARCTTRDRTRRNRPRGTPQRAGGQWRPASPARSRPVIAKPKRCDGMIYRRMLLGRLCEGHAISRTGDAADGHREWDRGGEVANGSAKRCCYEASRGVVR